MAVTMASSLQAQRAAVPAAPVTYSATVIRTTTSPAVTVPVTIKIQRWSTPEEVNTFFTALEEKGPEHLLSTVQALPEIGRISPTGGVGYPIHYATRHVMADGSTRVSILTDRWVSFGEATYNDRSMDYPYSVIDIRLGPDGTGQGSMSYATQVMFNKDLKLLSLENFENQPLKLQGVRRIDG